MYGNWNSLNFERVIARNRFTSENWIIVVSKWLGYLLRGKKNKSNLSLVKNAVIFERFHPQLVWGFFHLLSAKNYVKDSVLIMLTKYIVHKELLDLASLYYQIFVKVEVWNCAFDQMTYFCDFYTIVCRSFITANETHCNLWLWFIFLLIRKIVVLSRIEIFFRESKYLQG